MERGGGEGGKHQVNGSDDWQLCIRDWYINALCLDWQVCISNGSCLDAVCLDWQLRICDWVMRECSVVIDSYVSVIGSCSNVVCPDWQLSIPHGFWLDVCIITTHHIHDSYSLLAALLGVKVSQFWKYSSIHFPIASRFCRFRISHIDNIFWTFWLILFVLIKFWVVEITCNDYFSVVVTLNFMGFFF